MAYTNLLNQVRVGVRAGIVLPTFTPLLDLYGGAAAAYSLRKLRTGATASIRVRRSSDNQETDIGFNTDGSLDTTSLLSFSGNLNGVGYSQDIDNSYWVKIGSTVTANVDIAPDGTTTADMITETATSGLHGIYNYTFALTPLGFGYNLPWTLSGTHSWNMSFYAKKATGNTIPIGQNILLLCQDLGLSDGGSKATFDLDYGVATLGTTTSAGQLGAIGATMSDEGNGWWRCSIWGSAGPTPGGNRYWTASLVRTISRSISDKNAAVITGNTGAKYLIWGFQYKQDQTADGMSIEPYTKTENGGYGGYAHIAKWYDQSGNGRHVTQTTALSQPNIVKLKQVATNGGKPSAKFFNNAYDVMYGQYLGYSGMSLTGTFSLFTVSKFDSTGNAVAVGGNTSTNNWLNALINAKFANYVSGYVYGDSPNTDRNLHYLLKIGSSVTMGRNGSNNYTGTNTSMTLTGISIGAGLLSNGQHRLTGDIQEVVLYNSEKSVSTRSDIESNINSFYSIYTPISSDSDAMAFIAMAGLTNSTHQSAITTLVTSLKSSISVGSTQSLWTKMLAIYPFVGGTSTSHKFNLKDPRDLNNSFRLRFNGGWTHSSTGALPNGTNAFAETFLATRSWVSGLDSLHISFYSRTDVTSGGCDIGSGQHPIYYSTIYSKYNNAGTISTIASISSDFTYIPNNNPSNAFYLVNRNSISQISLFRNSTKISQTNLTRNYNSDMPFTISALNQGQGTIPQTSAYSNRESAFASIGYGLTDAESLEFYNIIQTYQTTLGRQV